MLMAFKLKLIINQMFGNGIDFQNFQKPSDIFYISIQLSFHQLFYKFCKLDSYLKKIEIILTKNFDLIIRKN